MNVLFFLTPKNEVIYEKPHSTMRQALERMEHHRYSSIPLIDDQGKYVGTITEGDLLWKLKNTPDLNFMNTSKIPLKKSAPCAPGISGRIPHTKDCRNPMSDRLSASDHSGGD
jgi:CBS domain containing-hemolysin-like protein